MGWILRSIQVQKLIKSNCKKKQSNQKLITKNNQIKTNYKQHNQSNIRNQLNKVTTPESDKSKWITQKSKSNQNKFIRTQKPSLTKIN